MDKAPGHATTTLSRVRTPDIESFRFFTFLFFMELPLNQHWRARARMSIRFQYLLAVDLFAEDAFFSKHIFEFLETCFLKTCFLFGGWNYTKELLTQKLFLSFSERCMISTPMDARGTN